MQPSPCSKTTRPISINDAPLDAPWSEWVPFLILLKLIDIKWTKLVQKHQKSMQPSPCSETTWPISINNTPLDAPWSESVPFWVLLKLVHVKWTKLVYVFTDLAHRCCWWTRRPVISVRRVWSPSAPLWGCDSRSWILGASSRVDREGQIRGQIFGGRRWP